MIYALRAHGGAAAVNVAAREETTVQRVYGVSFFDATGEQKRREERRRCRPRPPHSRRSSAVVMHHQLAPGSVFFLPHGTRILQRLQDFLRAGICVAGMEVETPQLLARPLWETSGH